MANRGRPKKLVAVTPKRVDRRDEEYYIEKALQTPGLLNGADYVQFLARLTEIRTGKPLKPKLESTPEQKNEKLRRLLGKAGMMQGDDSMDSVKEGRLDQ